MEFDLLELSVLIQVVQERKRPSEMPRFGNPKLKFGTKPKIERQIQ